MSFNKLPALNFLGPQLPGNVISIGKIGKYDLNIIIFASHLIIDFIIAFRENNNLYNRHFVKIHDELLILCASLS